MTAVLQAFDRLRVSGTGNGTAINILESTLGTLRNKFRLLSPESGVTRFQKKRAIRLMEAMWAALDLNRHSLDERRLQVSITGGRRGAWRPARMGLPGPQCLE